MKPFIIAIDGVAASGKGTLSEKLAQHYEFAFLDTGKMYRKLAYHVLESNIDFQDDIAISDLIGNIDFTDVSQSLHTDAISSAASQISVHEAVRSKLNIMQKDFPNNKSGAVIDGRDIGTVIFPNANIKFFVTAEVEIRAERRFKQLQKDRKDISFMSVLQDLKDRDHRDINRAVAPTVPASNAIVIDTSHLDANSVFELAKQLTFKAIKNHFADSEIS